MIQRFPGEIKLTTPYTSNTYVYSIQIRLQELNYNLGSTGVDSIFGLSTKDAIIKYQKDNQLSQSGIVDKITWDSLWSKYGGKELPSDTSDSYYTVVSNSNTGSTTVNLSTVNTTATRTIDTVGSFIAHLGSQRWMPLPVNPTQVSQQSAAQWESTQIPGRSSSFYHYTGTSNTTFTFALKLHTDMNQIVIPKGLNAPGTLLNSSNYAETGISIESFINFVESLTLPKYTSSIIRPPLCRIVIENVFNIRCFIGSYSITYDGPMRRYVGGTHKGKIGYTLYDVSFNVTEVPNTVVDAMSILETETVQVSSSNSTSGYDADPKGKVNYYDKS